MLSLNPKPKVDSRLNSRHLEKSIGGHTSAAGGSILMKFGTPVQNELSVNDEYT